MMINALNSGAKVFMADFEDALADLGERGRRPGRRSMPAVRELTFDSPEGKAYRLNPEIATLLVRPRGWHLVERHVLSTARRLGEPFDFGLYFFHNAAELLRRRQRPVLLPAEAREPPRGAPLERGLRPRPGRRSGSRGARSARPC